MNISFVFPPVEPKKLPLLEGQPLSPWALWAQGQDTHWLGSQFMRFQDSLLFVAHMKNEALWNKFWKWVNDAEQDKNVHAVPLPVFDQDLP